MTQQKSIYHQSRRATTDRKLFNKQFSPRQLYLWNNYPTTGDTPQTTFADIGGYYEVKEALNQRVLKPLKTTLEGDDRYERFGIQPSRGIMFYGPPGTGKTMFARALAGELEIPFVELSPGDVTSRWVN